MVACIDIIRKNIADITDKELDEVLKELRARQARLISKGADPSTAAAQAGMELSETLKAAAAIEKRNAAINRRIRLESLDYIRTNWADDPVEGVLALLYGSPKARFGSRSSANAAQSANFRRYIGGAEGELERAGLFDVLRRGELDKDVFTAMRSMNDEAALSKLPTQAVDIAKILNRWQEVARVEANRHGAWIGKLDDYGLRQSHNSDRIARAGEAKWKADIAPKLDMDRMFPDGVPKNMDEWLHETYLNLVTGVRDADPTAGKMSAFKGPGNLAKRLSQERVLHFTNADDAFQYNVDYGMGNIREAYVQGLHRSAESTGLMQVLGTNPEFNLKSITDAIQSQLSRSDVEKARAFKNALNRIENGYKEVSGQTRLAASAKLAAVGQGIRTWNMLTGLGGAVVSAVTDVPFRASLLRYQGQSYLGTLSEGLLAPMQRIVAGSDSMEKKAVLSAAGYFNEIAMGNLAARFSPDDSMPGMLSKMTNTFFKWNLLSGWTDAMRRSTLESMAHYWGEVSAKTFSQLSERNQRALSRFRIGEAEWSVLSKGIAEADGRKFMTPTAVRELDPELFRELAASRITEKMSPQMVNRVLDDTRVSVADRLQQFYADDLDSAVIQPDSRSRALLTQGTQSGTPVGEALRLFWQFKSFPIAAMQRGFAREFHGYGVKGGTSTLSGMSMLMLGSIGFGYMAMSMKDMLRGKTPRSLEDPNTWAAAATQGGGFGIYGDLLLGEANRMGGGLAATIGGPVVGKLEQAKQLYDSAKRGDDVAAKSLKFAISNTPYSNLFYTRMAADYLFLYEVQESLNPGYLRRMERKTEKETGQEWWLRPSDYAQ